MNQHNSDLKMSALVGLNQGHGAEHIKQAAKAAADRIAPLWPLKSFVAVNPFLGLSDMDFASAAKRMEKAGPARMTMPTEYYLEALERGRMTTDDVGEALELTSGGNGGRPEPQSFLADVRRLPRADVREPITVTDLLDDLTAAQWSEFVADRISAWAGDYFDEGQALWPSVCDDNGLFADWHMFASVDRAPDIAGLKNLRKTISGLPVSAGQTLVEAVARLEIPEAGLELYFHRLLMSLGGWAAFARHKAWGREQHGQPDFTIRELLVIRLAWEAALHAEHSHDTRFQDRWATAKLGLVAPSHDDGLHANLVLQTAFEIAHQRQLVSSLAGAGDNAAPSRKSVQAAFCIDVRSEVFRRALESRSGEIETLGFAGFFGIPMEYVPLGQSAGHAHCPVLVQPTITISETLASGTSAEVLQVAAERTLRQKTAKAWKTFKTSAISSFSYVDVMGLAYLGKLATDGLRLSRPVPNPKGAGLTPHHRDRLIPEIDPNCIEGKSFGIDLDRRIELAAGILTAMSLTRDLARLVVLVGHGATCVNNPHGASLDCGACGGHAGEANARVACAILNDLAVRKGLADRGIEVPHDTVFLPALHDTTTDRVDLFDVEGLPADYQRYLAQLRSWLDAAGSLARSERSAALPGMARGDLEQSMIARSRDWSQVRPEWGLAGCSSFIAAARWRTANVDLEGRAFLHSYDWTVDSGWKTLASIMTAPLVVATWISLQYYGSTVDNHAFGSGNKTLHNVLGTVGVLEGNSGILRTGLPIQSVHDGNRFVHEPMRLSAFIEAPIEAVDHVIARHPSVSQLVDNGWVHLFAIDADGKIWRYRGYLEWTEETPGAATAVTKERQAA